jgi:hypothetical protein
VTILKKNKLSRKLVAINKQSSIPVIESFISIDALKGSLMKYSKV